MFLRKEAFPEESDQFDFTYGDYQFSNVAELNFGFAIRDKRTNPDGMPITHRKFSWMEGKGSIPHGAGVWLYKNKKTIQLVSIGAGLDETLDFAQVCSLPPIIIDPLDPLTIQSGLAQIRSKYRLSKFDNQLTDTLLRRAQVYETRKVRHLQMRIDEVFANTHQIFSTADVVLDSYAANHYEDAASCFNYHLLLNPNGSQRIWVI